MRQYLGLSRYWYNQGIDYLRQEGTKASLSEVRQIQKADQSEWAMNCPQRIREHAMADAVAAVKEAKQKCRRTGKFQRVSFRARRDLKQGFGFDAISLKATSLFSKKTDRVSFYATENFEASMEGTKVVYECGRWYLIVPTTRPMKQPENQRLPLCALDPGVRTFQTFYAPGCFGKVGEGDFQRIYRLCLCLDRLISKMSHAKCRQKRRMRKAAERLRYKIRCLVDELHHKAAYFLVTRFDSILLPTFETSQMVTKLHSKTARSMLNWAHYRFKQFLKAKAQEYGATVLDVCEAYTSKTCSYCGTVQNIGSKKVMRCVCGVTVDRDYNGARGIFLRALAVTPSLRDAFQRAFVNNS